MALSGRHFLLLTFAPDLPIQLPLHFSIASFQLILPSIPNHFLTFQLLFTQCLVIFSAVASMLKKVNDTYNTLISKLPQSEVLALHNEIETRSHEMKLTFGGRPLTSVLRPKFITRRHYETITQVCFHLGNAIQKINDHLIGGGVLAKEVRLTDDERSLVEIDPKYSSPVVTARWDTFFGEVNGKESFKFVELNAETPAAIAYSDVGSELFLSLSPMKSLAKEYRITPFETRPMLMKALLSHYEEWHIKVKNRVVKSKPNIAIVDWDGVPTYTEFELFSEYFQSQGCNTIICTPQELEYKNGVLSHRNFTIDLIYKRVIVSEFLSRKEECKALFDAYRNHHVCMINAFRIKYFHKKAIFAVLTSERFQRLFSADERAAIAAHIPWTRVFEEAFTEFDGKKIDLPEFARTHKDLFVLKPNDEYGGKGVVLGFESSESEWEKHLESALRTEAAWVLQHKVPVPKESFPHIENGTLHFDDYIVDFDPFVFGNQTGGMLSRLSRTSLANVTSGAGSVPTFLLEEN
ncbi:MAG: hypothetical protein SFU91_13745 [Chloroherpetonaceae bacterium]|nr:hypothetical protein [Chloroherpetonaceae bacterium]